MQPIVLGPNQPRDRFYRGGTRIAGFRHRQPAEPFTPEDWVASVVSLFGDASQGPTVLPDGTLLAARVEAQPELWLGADHVARFGSDPALLVKLLDAGERLPVHAHPSADFAHSHLGVGHGKAEAWVMLEPAEVRLGFRREVSEEELTTWVDNQDTTALLATMNAVELRAGDAVFVPPGLPHAIGAGAFLVEVQEPTDLSILLEWQGFRIDGERDGHLGLGFAQALGAIDRTAWTPARLATIVLTGAPPTGDALPAAAAVYFRVERHEVHGATRWDPGFAVVVVVRGSGELAGSDGASVPVGAGSTVLVAHACGSITASGSMELLRCRPPAPQGV